VDDTRASNIVPKLWIGMKIPLVGEHSNCVEEVAISAIGAVRKANVGISNDKIGEKPIRR
jgi:hypothetical protein